MKLVRLYNDRLAQAAYLVVDGGEAVVIDPTRDTGLYAEAAARENAKIVAVTETHIHADFVSGARDLARRTGAALHLSDEGDGDWKYAYAAGDGARLVREGDSIRVGRTRLEARHTPGHTPEHLTWVVTDTAVTDRPLGAFTGDFLFVGDVGRPDLLETAAKQAGAADRGARTLFASVRRFLDDMPEWLQLWPGHGAGSACGKGIGAMPQSTIGYEKIANPLLGIADEERFVREVLGGLSDPPPYFAHMKRINRDGPPPAGARNRPDRLSTDQLHDAVARGALVVDLRSASEFAAGHIPGTINLPFNKSFLTWAGWLIPLEQDVYVIVDVRAGAGIDEVVRDLGLIGIERVAGWSGTNAVEAWKAAGRTLETTTQTDVIELAELRAARAVDVLDVRNPGEWAAGHMPDVPNIPLGQLPDRIGEVSRERPVVVHCQGGMRSAIATSILQARGIKHVLNLTGGFGAWEKAGQPVDRS